MPEQIAVSQDMLDSLNATRPWVNFLSIVSFVLITLLALVGMVTALTFSVTPMSSGWAKAAGPIFGVVYLLMACLYFMPSLFMYRYARAIARIPAAGQGALEDALRQQKSFWKFMGIFMAVVLCLYALTLVLSIFLALLLGSGHPHR